MSGSDEEKLTDFLRLKGIACIAQGHSLYYTGVELTVLCLQG